MSMKKADEKKEKSDELVTADMPQQQKGSVVVTVFQDHNGCWRLAGSTEAEGFSFLAKENALSYAKAKGLEVAKE